MFVCSIFTILKTLYVCVLYIYHTENTLCLCALYLLYRNDPKFSDRYAWANSADSDQTAPRGAV